MTIIKIQLFRHLCFLASVLFSSADIFLNQMDFCHRNPQPWIISSLCPRLKNLYASLCAAKEPSLQRTFKLSYWDSFCQNLNCEMWLLLSEERWVEIHLHIYNVYVFTFYFAWIYVKIQYWDQKFDISDKCWNCFDYSIPQCVILSMKDSYVQKNHIKR